MDRTYVMGQDCSTCHFLEPHVKKKAETLGKKIEIKDPNEMEGIEVIPTLITEDEVYQGQEEIVLFLNKK